jgi:hypothetical protein
VDAVGEPVLEVVLAPPAIAGQPAEHDWVHQEPDRVNGVFVAKTGSQPRALDDARHDPGGGGGTLRVEPARESRDLLVRARCFVHHRQQARDAVGNDADGGRPSLSTALKGASPASAPHPPRIRRSAVAVQTRGSSHTWHTGLFVRFPSLIRRFDCSSETNSLLCLMTGMGRIKVISPERAVVRDLRTGFPGPRAGRGPRPGRWRARRVPVRRVWARSP